MVHSPLRAAAAIVLLVALLAPTSQAQVANPGVTVGFKDQSLRLGANNTTYVLATVANTGSTAGTVTLALQAPQGWTTQVDPPSAFSLQNGQSATVNITLIAPAAATGAATGNVSLTANLAETTPAGPATGRTATATASVGVTRVDPIVPPPPPPPYGLWALAAVGSLAVVGAVIFAEQRRKRLARERAAAEHAAFLARETGITIRLLDAPRRFGLKRELIVRAEVKNVSERARVALVDAIEIPLGWRATPSLPRIELASGEAVAISYHIEPADHVPANAKVSIPLRAKPEEARVRDERVLVEIEAPDILIPPPVVKPTSMAREAVTGAPKPSLRY